MNVMRSYVERMSRAIVATSVRSPRRSRIGA
jgi:hypothetical protein